MAIEKDIAIHHTNGIENVITYTRDPGKATLFLNRHDSDDHMEIDRLVMQGTEQDIINALSYAENLEKTIFRLDGDDQLLTSGILCSKDHAALQFQMVRDAYYNETAGCASRIKGTKTDKKPERLSKKKASRHTMSSSPFLK